MRKKVLSLTMVLLGLFAGANTMQAINLSGMTPEEAETMGFWARLTAKPATTTNGSGKVFVVTAEDYDYEGDPEDGNYAAQMSDDGFSDIFLASSLINANAQFRTFAKADNGSYFTGWSFTDGYTDLGTESSNFWVEVTPSATKGHGNIRNYDLYAAFETVKIVSYEMVSGSQTTADDGEGNWKCTQVIKFRAETPGMWALSSVGDERHFKRPVVTKKTGTAGTWAIADAAWISSGAGQNVFCSGDYAELTVPVTFTAPNSDAGEYGATLTLETYAGVKMSVYLSARTIVAGAEAIRYNKSKVQQETGDLTDLLAHAAADDIIKLNGNYSDAVTINKNITFDLNGYTLNNTLTVSGGNVTVAYSFFGGSANALNVTGGKVILNGGTFGSMTIGASGTVEQNGATITGAATNNGSLTTTDGKFEAGLTSSKTLVVNGGTFNGSVAINVTAGTAQIKKGTISGNTYGIQSAGTTTIEKLASVFGYTKALKCTGGSLTVNNGKFYDPMELIEDNPAGTFVFNAGYFQMNGTEAPTAFGKQIWRNTAGAEARAGYAFFTGSQDAAQASNVSVCRIGHTSYNSLEEALAFANNSGQEVVIIMENDYVLQAGYYTLPSNATLIVPMSNEQETANQIVPRSTDDIPTPVLFRKLTFESGVNLEVAGTLEVTCTQYGKGETMGIPGGNFGHLILKPGSHMTINNGGYLRAWGFVTGDGTKDGAGNYLSGEIDVRRGGTVHEMFQMGDWKGGDISFTIAMEVPGMTNWRDMAHLFPIYTYFIQNVESPVKYHPGASLICATSVNVSGSINAYANDIKVVGKVGEPAMFLMDEKADAENTWVRKYYDAKKDQQVYEVNSGAQLGSMVINLGEVPGSFFGASGTLNLILDSRKFVLPLTNNFKIHLLSGKMEFTQSTSCLPGMEVEIDKESEVSIIKNDDETVVSGALYFYDADQWSFQNSQAKGYVGNSGKFGAIVRYSPTWDLGTNGATKKPNVRNITSPAAIGDAILNVHGTFRMGEGCSVYTTWAKDNTLMALDETESATGGASVISSNEDAGTFIFDADAPEFDGIHMSGMNITGFGPNVIVNYDHNDYGITSPMAYPVKIPTVLNQSTPTPVFGIELCTPVKLKNGDGTFVETSSTTAGTSYCYMNGQWTTMQVAEDECFMKEIVGGQTTYYAKPAEYVAVNATWDGDKMVGNADHTYSDKAGEGRLFILMSDCQWWEVEKKDNLYHCIHPQNDTYYYWGYDAERDKDCWLEQRFTITWLNWDGNEIKSYIDNGEGGQDEVAYSVTYGTMAEYLGSNPTRPADIDYTYNFTGWNPALGKVTSDVTYTATYEKQQRKYTIIFTEEGGTEIERQFLTHNETPVCENVPTRPGFTLQWEPEVAAVTGDATYRATWLEEPPTEYVVTFFDYNGTTELKKGNVAVGAMPVAPAIVNGKPQKEDESFGGKPSTTEFTYVFDHWSPDLEAVSATSVKSYTAVYREVAKKYTITFKNEDNSVIETKQFAYGETPVCSKTPTKANTAQYTYSFAWTPQIQTVMADATYTANFTKTTNKYTVKLQCNISGKCSFTGAGTYDYGTSVSIAATPADGYEFVKWQERAGGADLGSVEVNGDITLTAVVKESAKPNPEDLTVGINGSQTVASATDYMDVTLTSDGLAQSGQIINANNITLYGNADFILSQTMAAGKWYAIAVPWRVEANGGVFLGTSTKPAVLGTDYEICYYDGAVRAAQGKVDACWVYMKNLSTKKELEPGRAYMIWLKKGVAQIKFRKKAQTPLLTTSTNVQQYSSSNTLDANWNAIANPSLIHAYLNAGSASAKAQHYLADEESYDWFYLNAEKLVVGEPIYVQAPATKTVDAGASYAPRRAKAETQMATFDVNITAAGVAKYADHLSIALDENKEENAYVIGQDLVKFGVSTKVAQMWIDRYDSKLCVNTVAPEDETTSFPMSIFAPKAGEYTIAIEREVATEDYNLYLTYNGEAICNLSEGAYTLNLKKGADANYGLRIGAKKVATAIDEAVVDSKDMPATKVLINGQVFIIRGKNVYSIDGQLVK